MYEDFIGVLCYELVLNLCSCVRDATVGKLWSEEISKEFQSTHLREVQPQEQL